MNLQDVIATFGSVERARERLRLQAGPWSIEERNTATALALLGLDSLAADPEREAKVEADRNLAQIARRIDFAMRATENCAIIVPLDVQNELDALRVAVLGRPAPPSPSVAALEAELAHANGRIDALCREVDEANKRWRSVSDKLVDSWEERDRLAAALAASNANARGGE